jgi:hypothetical protein
VNVATTAPISLRSGPSARVREGWHCPGCGTNYSPDVTSCNCSPLQAFPLPTFPLQPPPSIAPLPSPYQVTC